jgi:hypothetical protein
LPAISCIFKGASKLAHSKSFVFDKKYAALGVSPGCMKNDSSIDFKNFAGETPALPVANRGRTLDEGLISKESLRLLRRSVRLR